MSASRASWTGGTSIFDFTDPANVREVAYFDPGGGDGSGSPETWSSYWYNGYVYASDYARGLDVYAVRGENGRPYRARHWQHLNPQTQEASQAPERTSPLGCRGAAAATMRA